MEVAILKFLNAVNPLSEEDCDNVLKLLKTKQLKKGDYWLEEGKVNHYVAFVDEGYLRRYWTKDGNEITDNFYFENDVCVDLPSIIGKTKLLSNVIAMQRTSLTIFSYTEFNKLCEKSLALEHLNRILVERSLLRFYNRTISFILKTPKERYDDLVNAKSSILQKATQYHIASYLGIGPQHLSRLRAAK
jgi:CRP/FNR family transcriptional regulator, anaerobic regulatory protein